MAFHLQLFESVPMLPEELGFDDGIHTNDDFRLPSKVPISHPSKTETIFCDDSDHNSLKVNVEPKRKIKRETLMADIGSERKRAAENRR